MFYVFLCGGRVETFQFILHVAWGMGMEMLFATMNCAVQKYAE